MPIDFSLILPIAIGLILVVLLILLAVVMFRTARFAIVPEDVEPVPPLEINAEAVAERLGRAVQFQTISNSEGEAVDRTAFLGLYRMLEGMFPHLHSSLKREYINEYSLLYTWPGKNLELDPVLLASHLDVVPVDPASLNEWAYPPFSGQVAEGFVWGRGTMDVKNGVIGILEAVEYLVKADFQPERTVYLAFGHDEEIGGHNGAAQIAATLKQRGVTLACVLDEGGGVVEGALPGVKAPVAAVGVAEKGYLSLVLEAEGSGGHSSMPPAHTTIGMLSLAVERLEGSPFPVSFDAIYSFMRYIGSDLSFSMQLAMANLWLLRGTVQNRMEANPTTNSFIRTTQAVTMVAGGIKDNILPRVAKAVVNFRLYPGDTLRSVYEHTVDVVAGLPVKITSLTGETLEGPTGWEASPVSDPESPQYAFLAYLVRRVFPAAAVGPYLVAGATDARYYAPLCPSVFRFTPMAVAIDDMERPHGVNERLSVENCGKMVTFYVEFLREMAGTNEKIKDESGEKAEEANPT
jgi:carboxypeptidase PM20D1